MMGGLCRDCRQWQPPRNSHWGTCSLADSDAGYLSKAYAQCSDTEEFEHRAVLFTIGDFGCVQFEAKD